MKKFSILLTFFLIFLFQKPLSEAMTIKGISADNFIKLISSTSQYVRIEGKILNAEITDNSKVIFLNFGSNFNTSLSALIYNVDIPAFIDAGIDQPDKYFNDKKVIIEGIIRISGGKPEVVINSPNQIKIIPN